MLKRKKHVTVGKNPGEDGGSISRYMQFEVKDGGCRELKVRLWINCPTQRELGYNEIEL